MRLKQSLLKLPVAISAEKLAADVQALPESAWIPHPEGFVGNEAVPLVTPGGAVTNSTIGRMGPTEALRSCPYILSIMSALGGAWGRSRLMGLAPGSTVPTHVDINYYWRTHLRIHIPVVTNPGVRFICGEESVHMAAGECWVFDSFQQHGVENNGSERRIHLVLDTVGSERLWDLIEAAESGTEGPALSIGDAPAGPVDFEQHNSPPVMSPWEIRCHIAYLVERAVPHPRLAAALKCLDRFAAAWGAAWARYADSGEGLEVYVQLIRDARERLHAIPGGQDIVLKNEWRLYIVLDQLVFVNAVSGLQPQRPPAAASGSVSAGTVR